ncbi:MAG: mechanosensitive ion channel family protein [Hydrogenophaga sp.]|uniref:mechanosensitive ion channel family protein n=1 Tax=Hydrogenophaga sp. TaxID=1904254 RepID=UPI0026320408|nr:mechanosensitive ion channel family protein [Hydrogenophaga sp.]MDM7942874.1 mechanosensitive ion channel family protein [Hydrogenophaga sp.]
MNDNLIEMAARWWVSLGGAATTLLRVTLIVVAAWLLISVLQRAIRTLRERIASRMDDRESTKRAETLGRVFRYLATVVVSLIAGMLVLAELGVSVAPILGAAGVVGLAIGFGAQSLVKDFFTGFFILLENQIRQGDVVKLGEHAGMVEVVTLRYVQLRDYDGNVHYVPNGHISTVVNMTRGFSNAVMDIGVAYRENVDEVMAVMRKVAKQLQQDPDFQPKILADMEIAGVESLADSAVIIRCRFRTLPLEQWGVKREYLRRVKAAFDEHGIEIPYPHMTVYAGQDREGKAPAFVVQQLTEA